MDDVKPEDALKSEHNLKSEHDLIPEHDLLPEDDLIPEDDLKPDTSDRPVSRSSRSRKPAASASGPKASGAKTAVSRQHIMIGVGILVLILLIVGIGSALKAPTEHQLSQQANAPKDINLSGAGSDAAATPAQPADGSQPSVAPSSATQPQTDAAQPSPAQQPAADGQQQPQNIGLPPISSTPTQAAAPTGDAQLKERVDLPGDINDALAQQQNQVNAAAQDGINAGTQSQTSLPTAPATVDTSIKGAPKVVAPVKETAPRPVRSKPAPVEHRQPAHVAPVREAKPKAHEQVRKPVVQKTQEHKPAVHQSEARTPVAVKPEAKAPAHVAAQQPAAVASGSASSLKSAPGSHFTLQLSAASQATSLHNFAKQQGLKNYSVYQTVRNGQPWFVLVSGNYASSADAKRAIASLPADVQAKKPWVKPVHQVQQDLKK
ncbi:SPOR domain-containing protein [Rouxiella sp. Mn2063]|uniref:SPOR domain-containing protein n=1 Tax=Rouxiella sp. Mn2063 TaxID=3395262 RepID=UPI003BCED26A